MTEVENNSMRGFCMAKDGKVAYVPPCNEYGEGFIKLKVPDDVALTFHYEGQFKNDSDPYPEGEDVDLTYFIRNCGVELNMRTPVPEG